MRNPQFLFTLALMLSIACNSDPTTSSSSALATVEERTSVGSLPGSLVVLPGGDASYSIPIEVPPGRAGLTPALSFEYNSGVGNDWLGVGWGIGGISAIEPCGRNHRDNGHVAGPFETDTNYCLDGAVLHRVDDAAVTNPGGLPEYRTRPDSFARITREDKDWIVERRDGTVDRYAQGGGANDEYLRVSTADRTGNRVEYHYEAGNGLTTLSRTRINSVTYNNVEDKPYASIDFEYASRPDVFNGWLAGIGKYVTQRLVGVRIAWEGEPVRWYRLAYFDQLGLTSTTGRSLLESIELCHAKTSSGSWTADVCLPPTRFRYQEGNPGIDPGVDVDLPKPDDWFAHAVVPADINGDGSDDLVFAAETSKGPRWAYARANRSVPSGFDPSHITELPAGEAKWLQVLDVNDDRLQDFVYLRDDTAFELLTGSQDSGLGLAQVFTAQPGETFEFLTAIDINGDGFRDVVTCEGPDEKSLRWVWYRNQGTVFLERTATDLPCRVGGKLVGDIDHDGATDVVELGQKIECSHSGEDKLPPVGCYPSAQCNSCSLDLDAERAACLADFNCDTFDCDLDEDIEYATPSTPDTCTFTLTGGTGYRLHTNQLTGPLDVDPFHTFESIGPQGPFLSPLGSVDIIGDGSVDLVFRKWTVDAYGTEDSSAVVIYLSTGAPNGFIEKEVAGSLLNSTNTKLIRFIDWESDGDTDILIAHDGQWTLLSYELDSATEDATLTETALEIGVPVTGQIVVGDYDGDGLADLLMNDGLGIPGDSTDRWWLYRHRNSTFRRTPARGLPDLLREVTNGYGETTSIDYRPLTDEPVGADDCTYPQRCDAAPRSVVAKHWVEDHPETHYSYFGPRGDMLGRRDLGFERVVITADRGPGYDPAITWLEYDNARFDQARDAFIGSGRLTRRTTWVGTGSNTSKHRVYQTLFNYALIDTAKLDSGKQSYFTNAYRTEVRIYELDNGISGPDDVKAMTPLSTRYIDVGRDAFGNVLNSSDTKNDNYLDATETIYSNDTTSWLIGKPTLHNQYSLSPEGNKGRTVQLDWYSNGLLDRVTRAPNDAAHRLSAHYEYDAYGNPTDIDLTDRYGKTIHQHVEYDAFARVYPTHVTNALGQTSATTWDFGFGVITRSADAMGVGPTYQLDEFGRTTRVEFERFDGKTTGEGAVITYVRRDNGAPKSASRLRIQKAPYNGQLAWTDYDQHGRVELDAVYLTTQASKRELDYDALDRVVAVGEPTWFGAATVDWTNYEWDNHDRLTLVAPPDGHTVEHAYAGFTVTSTDAEGRKVRRIHDLGGRLVESIDGYGSTDASHVCYRYGAFDQVAKMIRGCGTPDATTTTSYTYDPYGPKLVTDDPALGHWMYRYDGFDRLYESTDGNGARLRYDYDDLHRQIQRLEVDTGVVASWTYDTDYIGTLYQTSVSGGPTVRYQHDLFGRPSATTTILDGEQLVESYYYDVAGRLATTTMPAQPGLPSFRLAYAYSDRSLLIGLVDADSGTAFWEREQIDPAGRTLLESFGNGLQTKRTYDEVGRYTSLRTDTPGNPGSLVLAPGDVFWEGYVWDLSGNLQSRNDHVGTQLETFEYDALSRLGHVITTSGGSSVNSWATYDTFGNFVTRTGVGTYETTPGGRVLSTDDRAYTYDGNGNVRNVDLIGDLGYTGGGTGTANVPAEITWSPLNKPLTIEAPNGTTTITYDADGTVVRRVEPDRTTLRAGAYERITAKGVEDRYRIVGPEGVVAQVSRVKQLGIGDPESGGGGTSLFDETVLWVHSDHLGSPRAFTDASGAVVERLDYDAWGKPRPNSWLSGAPPTEQSLIDTSFGGHRDGGAFVDMGGRYFEPHSGVFLSPDPYIQAPDATQNLNRYIYVFQNPTSLVDPTGHFAQLSLSRSGSGGGGGGLLTGVATVAASFLDNVSAVVDGFRAFGRAMRGVGHKIQAFFKSWGDHDRGGEGEPQASRSTAVSTSMAVNGVGGWSTISIEKYGPLVPYQPGSFEFGSLEPIYHTLPGDGIQEVLVGWVVPTTESGGDLVDVYALDGTLVESNSARGIINEGDLYLEAALLLAPSPVRLAPRTGVGVGEAALRVFEPGCFVAGTLVETTEGKRPIEQIRLGDRVLARDPATGEQSFKEVVWVKPPALRSVINLELADAKGSRETIGVTPDHPFFVRDRGWIAAGELVPNDEVFTSRGGWLRVGSSTSVAAKQVIYNFEVSDFHTYFVGELGAFVHNTRACSPVRAGEGRSLFKSNRAIVLERDKVCQYCQARPATQADHVVSVKQFETDVREKVLSLEAARRLANDIKNLLGVCGGKGGCNPTKGGRTLSPSPGPGKYVPPNPTDRARAHMDSE